MSKFMEELLDMLPQDMCGYAMTPAGENLFMVRLDKDQVLLDPAKANLYHHITAQLLYLGQWA
jgi:hypothetical protein